MGKATMTSRNIKHGDWAAVFDGRKAIILENTGDHALPDLRIREAWSRQDRPNKDYGTDAPGRVFQSASDARSALESTDKHEEAEWRFIEDLARRLERAVDEGLTSDLIIVAPPRALGLVRTHYGEATRSAVRAEIARDLTHLPTAELERYLIEAMRMADPDRLSPCPSSKD
jgi:protein required for attachment to host cells